MYYKYRSLEGEGFYRCIDIIVNKRLFASKYQDLNDPMEGLYFYQEGSFNENLQYKLQEQKNSLRIISLSKIKNSTLMWSHYANGHRGLVFGVDFPQNIDIRDIIYGDIPTITSDKFSSDTCKDVLCRKLTPWKYEKEARVITDKVKIPIEIKEIIYGEKIDQSVRSTLRKIIKAIDPNIVFCRAHNLQ